MGKKKVEAFDFNKSYADIVAKADELGLSNDMVFQTVLEEFRRSKEMCDQLYAGIKEQGAYYSEEGSVGQKTFKSNPLNKDYVQMQKQLIATSDSLERKLANISTVEEQQDDFPY